MHRFQVLARIAMAHLLGVIPLGCVQNAEKPAAQADVKTAVQGNADKGKTNEKEQDLQADVKTLVQGNNEFAFDLYRQLAQKPGNIVFSPYSISTALGMTYAGARGNTAKEMAQALHFTLDQERLHSTFGNLMRKINGPEKNGNYQVAVANSLWGAQGLSLKPEFLRITQTDYEAGFQFANFASNPAGARRKINGWVQTKTNNKIIDLVTPEFITERTQLVLVNGMFFKAAWAVPFPEERTHAEDFIMPGAPAFKVATMKNTLNAFYMENDDFQLTQLMYGEGEVSMVIILPKKKNGLPDVEKKLLVGELEQALARVQMVKVQVALPKFKLTEGVALSKELNTLGMKDAFLEKIADFSGMETSFNRMDSLFISEVVHKGFVGVDEKGTEAAGATAVITKYPSSVIIDPPPAVPFRADHPFLFLIRHNATKTIIFLARLCDPRKN